MGNVFIRTYGCQMNVYDSELASGILTKSGYDIVQNEDDADVILVTGCTIREHADQRALGYLRQVLARKKKKKGKKTRKKQKGGYKFTRAAISRRSLRMSRRKSHSRKHKKHKKRKRTKRRRHRRRR